MAAAIAIRNVSLLVSRPTTKDSRQLNDPAMRPNPLDDRARLRDSGVKNGAVECQLIGVLCPASKPIPVPWIN